MREIDLRCGHWRLPVDGYRRLPAAAGLVPRISRGCPAVEQHMCSPAGHMRSGAAELITILEVLFFPLYQCLFCVPPLCSYNFLTGGGPPSPPVLQPGQSKLCRECVARCWGSAGLLALLWVLQHPGRAAAAAAADGAAVWSVL